MQITLPDPALVVLVGIAGCGKSTFARRHFGRTEVLSSDECRALVADDPNDQSATGDAFSLLRFILDRRLKRRRTSVVDATNLERKARRPYLRSAQTYGVPAAAVVIDIPLAVCVERDRRRPDRTVGEAVLRRQQQQFEAGLAALAREGYHTVHRLASVDEAAEVEVHRAPFAASERWPQQAAG